MLTKQKYFRDMATFGPLKYLALDIWLKRVDGKRGKDPKIEILAKGKCQKQKRKF